MMHAPLSVRLVVTLGAHFRYHNSSRDTYKSSSSKLTVIMNKASNKDISPYRLISELSSSQLTQLHTLYSNQWWSKNRSLVDTKNLVNNSTLIFAFVDTNGTMLAFCRVLSDKCYFAYIYDVIVDSEYRKIGLGRKLIAAVLKHPEIAGLSSIELVCRKTMVPFYEKSGFSTDYGESVAMQLKL